MTARYGLPYFQNFLNSDVQPNQVRSMCCRLQLDVRELLKRGNGLFGSAEQTGSLGVVTINCARLGYRHRGDAAGLYRQLDHLLELAFASLELKRKVIQQHMDAGLYPYTRRYLGTLRNHFSTIGVNGLHEMVRNSATTARDCTAKPGARWPWPCSITCARGWWVSGGQRAPLQPGSHARRGHHLSLRPRGTASAIRASSGRHAGGALLHQLLAAAGGASPTTRSRALELQDALQCKYTGGTVLHLYMAERIPPPKPARPWCAPPSVASACRT